MTQSSREQYRIQVNILSNGEPEGLPIIVRGRLAWMLQKLLDAGKAGVTTLDNPAPRIGHYLYALRKKGLSISTTYETHAGEFRGVHGRYRLESEVEVVEDNTRPRGWLTASTGGARG